jgi:WD40 repeat protein
MLSEVKALRAGHQLGWRDEALDNLARLAVMPTPRRDLAELRTEAVASIGEFGVKEEARFAVSGSAAYTMDFSPDSRTLVTACGDGNIDLWDVTARRHLRRHDGVVALSYGRLNSRGGLARFLPGGDLAFLDSRDGVAFRDPSGGESTRPSISRAGAKAAKLRSDLQGRWLAVGWSDGRIDVHDVATGALQRSLDWRGASDFAFSPDGRWLALQKPNGPLKVLPTSGRGPAFTLPLRGGHFPALAFSPDGAALAGVDDRAVAIWNLASGQELLRLTGHKESVTAIAFSPDGALVATSCWDAMTRIWDAHDGRPLASLPGPQHMEAMAFSPDETYLAAAATDGPACLYRLEGRREQRRLIGHRFGALCLSFHPRLPYLASASDDHAIMIWDSRSGRPVRRWIGEVEQRGLTYNPDGSMLASSIGTDQGERRFSVQVWDAEKGTRTKLLPGHQADVCALAFAPSGDRLASGDKDGAVILRDVESGRILRREKEGNSPVASVVFHDKGSPAPCRARSRGDLPVRSGTVRDTSSCRLAGWMHSTRGRSPR